MSKVNTARFHLTIVTMVAALCSSTVHAAGSEPENATPQDVFDGMRQSFRAEKAKGVDVRYQFNFSGPNGGNWWIDVKDGTFKMEKGKIANPNVTFTASDRDWVALSNGKLSGTWAFLTGRLRIAGDKGLARKLGEIFP
jgi:putative sterol carrier protein